MANQKLTLYCVTLIALVCSICCVGCKRQSKAEAMRAEKQRKDSITLAQARSTVAYSDSLLSILQQQADSLMPQFRYDRNEQWEDHGQYVHRLLQTQQNAQRNYLQAYVTDDGKLNLQSFYYGERAISHNKVKLNAGEVWVEAEGSNHTFEAEGCHEIVNIPSTDALSLLQFISEHTKERVSVSLSAQDKVKAKYYLQDNEKKALTETYHFALIMNDISMLEQALRRNNNLISVYEQRQAKQKAKQESQQ